MTNKKILLLYLGLANVLTIAVFSSLWAWEYHLNTRISHHIDAIVVPWMWLIAFFVPSYLLLRKLTSKALLVALLWSVFASFLLLVFICIAVLPFFDAMW